MGAQKLAVHYKVKAKEMEEEEAAEEMARRQKNKDVRATQQAQLNEKRQWMEAEREAQMRADAQTKLVMAEDDARFRAIADDVLQQAQADGKNVHPIVKAVTMKDIALLPASTGGRI